MKRLLFFAVVAILSPLALSAQPVDSGLITAILQQFKTVKVEAGIELAFVEAAEGEGVKMVYDLADNDPVKFKFEVKNEVLHISQSRNIRSASIVKATVHYRGMDQLFISRAKVKFSNPLVASMVDVRLDDEADFVGEIKCDDLELSLFTDSHVKLTGESRYLRLKISSSARANLRGLEVMSADINASNSGVVALDCGERLNVIASTNSVVKYWNTPKILRMRSSLISGKVLKQE